ncbi:MAG: bifunctional oligoribonuclease/PAP phosphatase NrnA [Bacilli bacterium]|nr:bifunctional oligoribonuclease/PAP phosphatase NrnA [Bacilli bacterium]MDD4282941.1 bifunctional oligoribonuclease/PAP phosphatase NrnA [Bacilli bacterium]MDD4718788.1 bifunctional oligoribonuclease/PAP phosphatase NrnA [Bacilli bacterium]
MSRNKIKKIYKKIKQYDTIVIARHVGPDPDAISSQVGLRDVILNTFPNKKVYAVGCPASKFKYLGQLDKFKDEMYENSLLIVLDVPDKARIDGVNPDLFEYLIKIDHHPYVEEFCDIEWIDETSSSAAQMVIELILNTKLKITKEAAEKLFIGVVADTNRFLFYYTTPKTFDLISNLIKKTNIDFTNLYEELYLRPLKEVKFQGYITNNLKVTENGLGYIMLSDEILKEYGVDPASAGNMVNNFNYIEEMITWIILSEDKNNNNIRGSIRSRGPVINEVAANYNGGGHIYASGVRLAKDENSEKLIKELDQVCLEYKQKQ